MKRIRTVLWIGIALMMLAPAAAAAAEKAPVTLTAAMGGEREIVLTVGVRNTEFNALQLAVGFDPDKLTPRLAEGEGEAQDPESMTDYLAPLYYRGSGWMQCEFGEFDEEAGIVELTLYVDPASRGRDADADGFMAAGTQGLELVSLHFTLDETAVFTADTIELAATSSNDRYVILSAKNPQNVGNPTIGRGKSVAERDFTALGIALSETEEPEEDNDEAGDGNAGDGGATGGSGGENQSQGTAPPEPGKEPGQGSGQTENGGATGGSGGENQSQGTAPTEPGQEPGQGSEQTENGSGPWQTGPTAEALSDMRGHWAEGYVQALVSRGLVSGYPDGTFRPEAQLNRSEFCVVLCKMAGISPAAGENRFSDLQEAWAAPYINALADAGKVSGVGGGRFEPERAISRQEAAVLLSGALELPETERTLSFTDAQRIETWALDSLKRTVAAGLFSGYEDGTLRPEGLITRGEMAAAVTLGLEKMERESK